MRAIGREWHLHVKLGEWSEMSGIWQGGTVYNYGLLAPHYPVPATLAVGQTYWQQQQRLGNWLPNT